jgi:hypothetical protein
LRPIQISSSSDKLEGVSQTNQGECGRQITVQHQNIMSMMNIFVYLLNFPMDREKSEEEKDENSIDT